MRNSQRILTFGVFAAFGLALAAGFVAAYPSRASTATLLPVAYAAPAEISVLDTLRAGETLSDLFSRSPLASGDAQALLAELRLHQDPRRLRPGAVVSYHRSATDSVIKGLDIQLDADRTLSLDRDQDGWSGAVEEIAVHPDTVVLTGVVKSSLYAALVGARKRDEKGVTISEREGIVDQLADRIFAWKIDFSRDLRSGDRFRLLYERMVRPDGTARSGRVLSVQFNVNHRNYGAYLFHSPDGSDDYYARDGKSLRSAFLKTPLKFRRISSVFSASRFHPILKKSRPHYGIDYAANAGTPVHATADGIVTSAGWSNGYGNLIILKHTHGYSTRYGHMRAFAKGIHAGVRVKQGEVIGYVGMTGLATGPHLHYEFRVNGTPVDPAKLKFVSGDPVPSRYLDDFKQAVSAEVLAMNEASSPVLLADASSSRADSSGR